MSNIFHTLRVREITKETDDCVSVAFDIPNEYKDKFSYVPGQYLTLQTEISGESIRRSYSICSSEDEPLRVAIKQVPDGKFSTYANEHLNVGDHLEVMPPQGHFFKTQEEKDGNIYVGFVAGSGITPVMSILKTVLKQESNSKFILFYGNRRSDSIIFKEQLDNLKNVYLGQLEVHHILSREDTGSDWFTGRITKEKCSFYFDKIIEPSLVNAFYLCGPYEMTLEVKESLLEQGVEEQHIRTELFFVDTPKVKKEVPYNKLRKSSSETAISIILDGQAFHFNMDEDNESILDVAIEQGIDVPYSCKGGVCSTCKAKVEIGEVEMMINYALEQDEVDAGYVLSCQCYPQAEEITLNFDV